jgi:hypothetical protein
MDVHGADGPPLLSNRTSMTEQKRAAFKKLIERHARVNTVSRETAQASLKREDNAPRSAGVRPGR